MPNKMTRTLRATILAAAGAFALALAAPAGAGDVKLYKEGEVPSAEDLSKMFNTKKKPKTRAIVIGNAPKPTAEAPDAFAFPILFGLNSAEVPASAVPYLDAVGKMMQMQTDNASIVVEGHTDASGSDDYNLRLSDRRAASVKQYLIERYGVDPARVTAVGKGEAELYNKDDPRSSENRRVQFRRGS